LSLILLKPSITNQPRKRNQTQVVRIKILTVCKERDDRCCQVTKPQLKSRSLDKVSLVTWPCISIITRINQLYFANWQPT